MMNTTANRSAIVASAKGYTITLTDDRVSISRSGVWAGNGRWQDGRIVDCAARLGDTDDESDAIYDALETALGDEVDEAEVGPAEYIVVQAAYCDGGFQAARLAPGEDESACARRYGACIRSYGPEDGRGAWSRHYTLKEARAEVRRIRAEEAEYEARREAESAPRQVRIPITTQDMRREVAESAHDSDPEDYEAAYRGALAWISEETGVEIDTSSDAMTDDSDLAQEIWQLACDMLWWDGSSWQWDDDLASAHDRADRIRNQ